MFASRCLCLTDAVVTAMQAILLPHDENISALQQPLPMCDDGNSMANQVSTHLYMLYHSSNGNLNLQ